MGSRTLTAIERLELELIVRDFLYGIEHRNFDEVAQLLHPDVTITSGLAREIHGRASAMRACRSLFGATLTAPIRVLQVLVTDDAVLSEQEMAMPVESGAVEPVTVISCYRIEEFMIKSWNQLYPVR